MSKVENFMQISKQTRFPQSELSALAWINYDDGTLHIQHSNSVSQEKAIEFAKWILDVYGVNE